MSLSNPRFAGDRELEACAAGEHVMEMPEKSISVRRVQWALLDLEFNLPVFGADGVFGEETAAAVSAFKQSRGIEPSDGKVGVKTMSRLDTEPLPSMDELQLHYSDRHSFYSNRALTKAHDHDHADWDPTLGWLPNRARVLDLYGYYRDLYLASPDEFLWAGLGRMAGGAVVGGLDLGVGPAEQEIFVRIGRDIFFDLAWLHEAFLEDPFKAIELGHLHDRFNEYTTYVTGAPTFAAEFPIRSYGATMSKIRDGRIAEGCRDLLENEQKMVIQPHYDAMPPGLQPRPFANEIHPYHRAFIRDFPSGDLLKFSDRWAWITRQDGMLQRWDDIGAAERIRLASLSLDELIAGRFGPAGKPELLPPGGP